MFAQVEADNWQFSRLKKNLNVAFFLDTIEARSFKLSLMLRVCVLTLGLMTLILFQGHKYV